MGLEVGTYGIDGLNPETSVVVGLSLEQARYLARELKERADDLSARAT
ncbi:hypothetical protein [Pseudonocardia sp. 73-21]|nr:hypothetical protein [Pseudonocardia sp. 73-21]